ncbi:MAG: phosphomethylpyrimidine synthase ThiC [Desulfovibrionaceae bacterium]|nr:phosphomethylpyrimidine synthase ThiC [Desulfovibrionaceae bacterium]
MGIRELNPALENVLNAQLDRIALEENLEKDVILSGIDAGTIVALGNPRHPNLTAIIVGQPARVKINANLGTSPLQSCLQTELEKIKAALDAKTDTIMDLSTSGDLDEIRVNMLKACPLPVGTVPIYSVAKALADENRDIASMTADELLAEIEKQCKQGVDFITVHCGLTKRGAMFGTKRDRVLGIVSRGGSMLTRWMIENNRENPLLENFDRLLDICRPYNVTLSLGDGLRPGACADAGDAAQWEEVINLGELALHGLKHGVQCMIEGPGHMALNLVEGQITAIKRLTHNAPLYVLGPLVCDSTPGYDHIAGAIGGAIGVTAGVDFLCYLTPAEHLTLPNADDVKAGVMASRVAAHAGEVALGKKTALVREADMNKARRNLDWEGMTKSAIDPDEVTRRRESHKQEEVCAMCGKFCSVKMLRDIGK